MQFVVLAFIVLLIMGLRGGELTGRHAARCLLLAAAGIAVIYFARIQPLYFVPWLAAIDIYLLLRILGGDVTIR